MRKRATIVDVARAAGVSRSMVSYVLNNRQDCKARPETVAKIEAAVKSVGYQVNLVARSLRVGKTQNIGIAMPAPSVPFYAEMLVCLQKRLGACGYSANCGFWTSSSKDEPADVMRMLLANRIDGLITWECCAELAQATIPTVLYTQAKRNISVDQCGVDCPAMIKIALRHLLEQGYDKIGYLGNISDERAQCLAVELKERKLEQRKEWFIAARYKESKIRRTILNFIKLKQLPEAIMVTDDMVAVIATSILVEAGVKIPEDMAILALNDSVVLKLQTPAISAMACPAAKIAKEMVKLLLNRIDNKLLEQQYRAFKSKIMIRESTRKIY